MTPSRQWTIGRAPECDLVVAQAEVSARHCCLTRTPQGWILEDLGSSNGTFVNGARLLPNQRVRVTPGDRVTLGQSALLPWPDEQGAPARVAATQVSGRAVPHTVLPGTNPPPLPPTARRSAPAPAGSGPGPARGPAKTVRVGRAPDNDVVLDQPSVSAYHARVHVQGERAVIEDVGSSNGTFVGTPHNRVQRAPLTRNDVVFLGSLRVPAARLMGLDGVQAHPVLVGSGLARQNGSIRLGRAPDNDQVLEYPMISAYHARLTRQDDGFVLEDLGSSNGTFVNGTRITRVAVQAGDVISLGSYLFTVTADGNLQKRDIRGNTTLEARGLSVRAGGKELIGGVNLTIFPGEFVGLMGPSGAGKTTLMNALNGYTPPAEGSVLINGQDLYRHYDQFRSALGYVPQEDVMHRDLTVGQALYYSARLRLPPDYSHEDIQKRIRTVLEQLSLQGTENVLIGSAEVKGISGGQRRRVNLAMELLTDPQILFLDEPTSGLSSEDALTVMKVLRKLADDGKTILLTIHQPSLEVYRLMDNLVLMGKDAGSADPGRLVYFGPAYPDAVHHFNPDGLPDQRPGTDPSPDEVLRGLKKRPTPEWVQRYKQSSYHQRFVRERAGSQLDQDRGTSSEQQRRISPFFQWWMLVRRLLTIKLRDKMNTAILLVQAPIVAVLIVMVFGKTVTEKVDDENWLKVSTALGTSLFVMSLAALWFGASNAVREIVGEWAIYRRERMVSLRIGPYVASKFTVLGLLALIQCLTLLGIVHLGCDLKGPKTAILLMLLVAALVGTTVGLILSAVAKTNEVAIALLPIVLLPMVILGGALLPLHRMDVVTRTISYAIPTRWGFEGVWLIESKERPHGSPIPKVKLPPGVPAPKEEPKQDMAEDSFRSKEKEIEDRETKEKKKEPKTRTSSRTALGVLVGMLLAGVASVALILRLRDVH